MFRRNVLVQRGFSEPHPIAERAGVRLGLLRAAEPLAPIIQLWQQNQRSRARQQPTNRLRTEIRPREYALHGVVHGVSCVGGPGLVTGSAEVVVVADEAFVPATPEVALEARVATDACEQRSLARKGGMGPMGAGMCTRTRRKCLPSWVLMSAGLRFGFNTRWFGWFPRETRFACSRENFQ